MGRKTLEKQLQTILPATNGTDGIGSRTIAQKGLGFWMLTALVVGNMIGSGIFLLPPSLAVFGWWAMAGWIFTAIGALLLALIFAKLGQVSPRVGGPYAYCRDAFGDFAGFLVAYNYWIALWVGNAGIAVAFTSYLSVFFSSIHSPVMAFYVAAGTVWFLTLINILGVREAGFIQLVTTVLKILPLVLLGIVALFFVTPDSFSKVTNLSGQSPFSAVVSAAALTLWAFIGLESATVPAEEVENPKKNIPRATLFGVMLAALIYILSTMGVMLLVPSKELVHSVAPYADAAAQIFGSAGRYLVAAGAAISAFGTLNGWILLQGRIPYAAASDGLFPKIFGVKGKSGTPTAGLLISAVLITCLLAMTLDKGLVGQFTFIILLAVLANLVPYLLTSMGFLVLMLKEKTLFGGVQAKRFVVIAIFAFLYSFWAFIGAGKEIVFYGSLLFFSGVPLFVWNYWRVSRRKGDHGV